MDEFVFLLCKRCQGTVQNPKLLLCLHNLCTECLEETKPIGQCSICNTAHSQGTGSSDLPDNVFFSNLQAKLDTYQKIASARQLTCPGACEKEATFWCSECRRLFCNFCFELHQSILKQSHEAKSLNEIRQESSRAFLAEPKRLSKLFCPKDNHSSDPAILYCNQCKQSMCCTCALLDRSHTDQHCEIQMEIQNRQTELQRMHEELQEKKENYSETYSSLQGQVKKMEEARNEVRQLIQEKFDEMIRILQERKEKLLADVEEQHRQQVCKVEKKMDTMGGIIQRMVSSQQLVEKMELYASKQELFEMQPHIKESLEELQQKQPLAVDFQEQGADFSNVQDELKDLFERLTREREPVLPIPEHLLIENMASAWAAAMPFRQRWSEEETMCLVSAVTASPGLRILMSSRNVPNERYWDEVRVIMANRGFPRSLAQLRAKWKWIKQAFFRIKSQSNAAVSRRPGWRCRHRPSWYRMVYSAWVEAEMPKFRDRGSRA